MTATHGEWCGSRTFATTCRRDGCGVPVWFFSCNCGCGVLFDDLGPPWPVHDCDESWARNLNRRTDADGTVRVQVAPGAWAVREPDVDLDEPWVMEARRGKSVWLAPIESMDPFTGAADTVAGIIRDLHPHADPHSRYKIPMTSVGTAMLGPIGRQPVGLITVHAPSPEEADLLESFTCWVPSASLEGVKKREAVVMSIRAVDIPGDCVWFCDVITIVRGA